MVDSPQSQPDPRAFLFPVLVVLILLNICMTATSSLPMVLLSGRSLSSPLMIAVTAEASAATKSVLTIGSAPAGHISLARPQRVRQFVYRVDVSWRRIRLAATETHWGMIQMIRRLSKCLLALVVLGFCCTMASEAQAQRAFGRSWGTASSARDWDRFYHYPYVYYPQNFYSKDYYRSSDSMYYRYPSEMRVPVYNKQWHNFYPEGRLYHRGHHFNLDVF